LKHNKLTRRDALKQILVLPALAGALAAGEAAPALAVDNKKQFHYQDTPRKNQKCSGCRFFRAPKACKIVTGTITPNGWCIAWAKK
jgi:hypothetical protein